MGSKRMRRGDVPAVAGLNRRITATIYGFDSENERAGLASAKIGFWKKRREQGGATSAK